MNILKTLKNKHWCEYIKNTKNKHWCEYIKNTRKNDLSYRMFFLNGCFAFLASQTLLFILIKWYSLHRGILLYIIWTCWKEKGPPPPLHPLSLWGEGESNISAELCVDDSIGQWWCLRIYGKYEYVFFYTFLFAEEDMTFHT